MAQHKERLTKAGDYNLDVAEILSYTIAGGPPGKQEPYRIDIQNIISSIELQQGIFNSTMVGKIQVYDTKDVRSVVPLTGLEKLNLKFHTPGLTGICAVANEGHPFHIYKIESVTPDNRGSGGGQAYDIFFCSRETYYNNLRKVSKAYTGQVELGVEDIFKNTKYLNSRKSLYVEPTKKHTRMVIPNVRPFEAIDMLARKAVSGKYENAGYLFYETKEGYQFRSIESLLAVGGSVARPAKWNYQFGVKNVRHHSGGKQIVNDLHQVDSWNLSKPVDILPNIEGGAYASKLIEHDMFNKTINETVFDYKREWANHFHTEHKFGGKTGKNLPLPDAKFDTLYHGINKEFDQKVMFKSNTAYIHDTQKDGITYTLDSISSKHTTQKAMSQRQLLSNGILEIIAPGNSTLQAGDIITFDMPLMEPIGHNKKLKSNPYWAGRYLIYDIKHMIDRQDDRYSLQIRAVKDTVAHPYVAEYGSWSHMAPAPGTHNIYKEDNELLTRMTNAQGLTSEQHKAFRN
tara:strand:- start:321 stop:1865 length:1545 start_codon:yes stop_codon:yes gene_type:complete